MRAPPQARAARGATGRFAPRVRARLRRDGRASTTAGSSWVLDHQRADAAGRPSATVVAHRACWRSSIPKGFFPQQDTGLLIGVTEAPPDVSFARDDGAAAGASPTSSAPIPTSPRVASFIGADGTNPTLNSGRLSITLKPRDAARRRRRRRSSRACSRKLARGRRHHALPAGGAGPADRQPRQPHAVPVHARGRRPRRARARGRRSVLERAAARCRELRDVASDQQIGGAAADAGRSIATPPRASASRRRPSTTRSTTPSASAGLDHLHPAQPLPRDPRGRARVPAEPRRARADLRARAERASRCRSSAFARFERGARAARRSPTRGSSRR